MTDPLATITTRKTDQTRQADPAQEKNRAGGYTFVADDMNRLRRFLAMGVEGGTYYAGQDEVAIESSTLVLDLIRTRPTEVLATVVDMSTRGATTKQQPLMFTMAALAGAEDPEVRALTLNALPTVARTASHLFLFASYVKNFRGWGKGLRKGIARWYDGKDVDALAYQIEKYGSRYGYGHRDLLLLSHAGSAQSKSETADPARKALYAHAAGKPLTDTIGLLPFVTVQATALADSESVEETVRIIADSPRVSWEMVKSEHLGDKRVWEALLDGDHVPIGALIKNLGRLTANGTLDPFGQDDRTARVIGRLTSPEVLAGGRIHPMATMLAGATYHLGHGLRGSLTWHPIPNIEKALHAAFLASFGSITPDDTKTVVLGMDVSGSMDGGSVGGLPMVPRDAAAGLAMALAAQFPRNLGLAFTGDWTGQKRYRHELVANTVTPINFDPLRRLPDLIAEARGLEFGRTDCALPIKHALDRGLAVDAFVVLTDNETYAGDVHPHQMLRTYRERTGINARMVTVSLVNNHSTIADPKDPLMLDVVGLDNNVVSLVGDFIAGRV